MKITTYFIKAICLSYIAFFSLNSAYANDSEVIGGYANGCIKGAVPLVETKSFQVQKWGVNRNYGHPSLIDYIYTLSHKAQANHLPKLLIGDLSKQYGGPFGASSSHGSHQSGLDVDISFDFSEPKKSEYELTHTKDVYLVDTHNKITPNFDNKRVALIYLAANDPRVERIFVAPGIKKTLCNIYEGHDKSWLQKLRPWFGHRGHMHVRLACPVDSNLCVKQPASPQGDGCGAELDSWLNPPPPSKDTKPAPKKPKKVLPIECQQLFKQVAAKK